MVQNERQFLLTALRNYSRCMATGDAYDLRVGLGCRVCKQDRRGEGTTH